MLLSFSAKDKKGNPTNFEQKIKDGIKSTTIRKGFRWKEGNLAHMATGVRTKKYNCFEKRPIKEVERIWIGYNIVLIDGIKIKRDRFELLIKTEGFDSEDEFWDWFPKEYYGQLLHF